MFQGSAWIIVAVVAGTTLLWCKEGREKLQVYSLSRLVQLLPFSKNTQYVVQVVVFVALGSFIALLLTEPSNPRQAFAAGLGWTAGLTRKG